MASVTANQPLERPWLWRSRAWISLLLLGPAFILVAFSRLPWELNSWAEYGMTTFGWVLFLTGGVFRFWASLYIGSRKASAVIQEGPYSICRHPLYFGSFLLALSAGFIMQSVVLIGAILLVSLVYFGITLPREEAALIGVFGQGYRDYQSKVAQLIPNPSTFRTSDVIEVHLAGMQAEVKRAMRWVLIPGGCYLLLHLRAQAWWPTWTFWQ
jgi:protein-S-isoprenylcysteine O-methyltransferase Ste14